MTVIDTDYLIVGAGAAGMAFADALIAECETDVVMVERRHCPAGHWNDAYPFVRIHQASANYGVNSRVLGTDSIDPLPANSIPSGPLPCSRPVCLIIGWRAPSFESSKHRLTRGKTPAWFSGCAVPCASCSSPKAGPAIRSPGSC